jgi:hypothetical protein
MIPTVRYPEAIVLALAIAAALGGWASTVLERAADPEKVCAQQLKPAVDELLWNVHCGHVAANRELQRPTELAGHGRTIPARSHSASAE